MMTQQQAPHDLNCKRLVDTPILPIPMGTAKRLMTLPVGSRAANAMLLRQKLLPQSSCQCPVLKAASECAQIYNAPGCAALCDRSGMEFCSPIAVFACTCSPLLPAAMPIRLAPYPIAAVRACAGSLAIGGQSGMQVRAAVQPGAMNCKRCRRHANTLPPDRTTNVRPDTP